MELSNSGRQQQPASSRMLDDGITSGSKEMVGGSAVATLSSREIVRRLMRADLDLDRTRTPVAVGKIDPQMGSVFRRGVSPVQHIRSRNATVDGFALPHPETPTRSRIISPAGLVELGGSGEGGGERLGDGESSGNDLRRKWGVSGEYAEQNQPGSDQRNEFGSDFNCPSGDFHYLPTSRNLGQIAIDAHNLAPQIALGGNSPHELVYGRGVSTQIRESSTIVPERFHQGRESLSVTRNVTVRESKRSKARAHDQDYRRRSSVSPFSKPPLDLRIELDAMASYSKTASLHPSSTI